MACCHGTQSRAPWRASTGEPPQRAERALLQRSLVCSLMPSSPMLLPRCMFSLAVLTYVLLSPSGMS